MYLILRKLIEFLPLYTEDGKYISSVERSTLIELLNSEGEGDKCLVVMSVEFVENLFDSFCVLDQKSLLQAKWKFKSYPAQLMARSLLSLLCDKQQKLFNRNFWSHHTGELTEKQREVLHYIETSRVRCHEAEKPQPIRFVNVAWGFIVINGKVLFHHREDARRIDIPNYVPVGGRLVLDDIEGLSDEEAAVAMQKNDFQNIEISLINTLKREVEEETGLLFSIDYDLNNDFMRLNPSLKVEGTGANHAYTEYNIVIWALNLTQIGFFKLIEKMSNTDRLVFFDFESIVTGRRADGKNAYLNALHDSFNSKDELLEKLGKLPVSYNLDFIPNVNHTFPINEDYFLVGKSGKESVKAIKINTEQINLLHTLAWHGKGLDFETVNPCISIHMFGWIQVHDLNVLDSISELAGQLTRHGLNLIDINGGGWVKIKLTKDKIFFSDKLFSLNLIPNFNGDLLEITARSITSVLGKTIVVSRNKKVPEAFFRILETVNNGGTYSSVGDGSLSNWMARLHEGMIFQDIGLKQVVRIKKKNLRLFNQ